MSWVLVFINLIYNAESGYKEPTVEAWYEFSTMTECFIARESLIHSLGSTDGYAPVNTQAVCIRQSNE